MSGDARGNLESIKSDYRALGVIVRAMMVQVVFSILLVRGMDGWRMALILHVKNCLHSCCQKQDFGLYDQRTLLEDQWLSHHKVGQKYLCQWYC